MKTVVFIVNDFNSHTREGVTTKYNITLVYNSDFNSHTREGVTIHQK